MILLRQLEKKWILNNSGRVAQWHGIIQNF